MMRLPYYLYTYQQAAERADGDRPSRPGRMPALLLVATVVWVALVAFAVLGQW